MPEQFYTKLTYITEFPVRDLCGIAAWTLSNQGAWGMGFPNYGKRCPA